MEPNIRKCRQCGKMVDFSEPYCAHETMEESAWRNMPRIVPAKTEVGVAVTCTQCGRLKKPVGRSAPLEMANSLCDHDCEGYYNEPKPGDLWPGETREDFGY